MRQQLLLDVAPVYSTWLGSSVVCLCLVVCTRLSSILHLKAQTAPKTHVGQTPRHHVPPLSGLKQCCHLKNKIELHPAMFLLCMIWNPVPQTSCQSISSRVVLVQASHKQCCLHHAAGVGTLKARSLRRWAPLRCMVTLELEPKTPNLNLDRVGLCPGPAPFRLTT